MIFEIRSMTHLITKPFDLEERLIDFGVDVRMVCPMALSISKTRNQPMDGFHALSSSC
jgi:hypothetical protein